MADQPLGQETVFYVESDLPPGMTIAEYRTLRTSDAPREPRLARWYKRLCGRPPRESPRPSGRAA